MPVENNKASDLRIFLAHPKDWGAAEVAEAEAKLLESYQVGTRRAAERAGQAPPKVTVTSGLTDFQARARNLGGFRGWVPSVTGKLTSGALRFTHVVVPMAPGVQHIGVGRATADIVRSALDTHKHTVVGWDGARVLRRILFVQEIDAENIVQGWGLYLEKKD